MRRILSAGHRLRAVGRPLIGICSALERARWSVWDQQAFLTPRGYVDAVHRAGGLAVLVPPDPELETNPDEILDRLDGLILAGGADIDPANYGADPHPATNGTVPERDTFEIAPARRGPRGPPPPPPGPPRGGGPKKRGRGAPPP